MAKDDDKGAAGEKAATGAKDNTTATGANESQAASSGSQPAAGAGAATPAAPQAAQGAQTDAITLLKADHRAVEKLFTEFEDADDDRKSEIVEQACQALILHTILEEEIFYPACREAASDEDPLDEAQVEHDSAKLLIVELLDGEPDDEYRDAKFTVLAEQIKHHVAEEEQPTTGIFAKAQAAKIDLAALGRRIQARKQQLESRGDLRPTRPVSFQNLSGGGFASGGGGARAYRSTQGDQDMPRNQGPDRDDRGRFTSDDDDRGGRYGGSGRSSSGGYGSGGNGGRGHGGWYGDSEGHSQAARGRGESRSYADDDDDRGGYGGQSRDRDDRGRFTGDDDDRGYRASGGGRGQSGWYGDSQGHSEASRRGWDERGGGYGGRSYRDDNDGYRGRDRDDGDRGYRASDGGRGQGWYGDSQGHSDAARRGWDERGGGNGGGSYRDDDRGGYRAGSQGRDRDERGRFTDDDDDRRYSSRSRDDDDRGSRSSSSGRGHGGWFGDARGHAEAARRGWEDRR